MAYLLQPRTLRGNPFAPLNRLRADLAARARRRAAFRRTYDELSRLSARELADLGLAPGDIAAVSREAARRA